MDIKVKTEAEEICETLLKIFAGAPQQYDQNYEAIGRLDNEQQDILHEIELSEMQDQEKGYSLYVILREIRRNRRQLRIKNELLQPLVELLRSNENFRHKIYKTNEEIKKISRLQSERSYKARVREDLSICEKNKEEEEEEEAEEMRGGQ
jgi:hypothetical protein